MAMSQQACAIFLNLKEVVSFSLSTIELNLLKSEITENINNLRGNLILVFFLIIPSEKLENYYQRVTFCCINIHI